jgi:hypothetical protein
MGHNQRKLEKTHVRAPHHRISREEPIAVHFLEMHPWKNPQMNAIPQEGIP